MFTKDPNHDYNFGIVASNPQCRIFGAGKTILLVDAAMRYKDQYQIVYANFHLNEDIIENFIYIDPNDIDHETILGLRKKSLLLIQEGINNADRRVCMLKKNRRTMYALFQMRKRLTDVFIDIPLLQYIEMRVSDIATQYIEASGQPKKNHPIYDSYFQYSQMGIIRSRVSTGCYFRRLQTYVMNMEHCYQCYDTNEESLIKDVEPGDKIPHNHTNLLDF